LLLPILISRLLSLIFDIQSSNVWHGCLGLGRLLLDEDEEEERSISILMRSREDKCFLPVATNQSSVVHPHSSSIRYLIINLLIHELTYLRYSCKFTYISNPNSQPFLPLQSGSVSKKSIKIAAYRICKGRSPVTAPGSPSRSILQQLLNSIST
jgi:hypothetical protein